MIKSNQDYPESEDEWEEATKYFRQTKIPRCSICGKEYVNAVDSITKKISPYLWKPSCKHNKNVRISIG